jgi:hypothetical protein
MAEAQAAGPSDPRLNWLGQRVVSSLKCGDSAWDKLLAGETTRAVVTGFLEDDSARRLLVYADGKELSAVSRDQSHDTQAPGMAA